MKNFLLYLKPLFVLKIYLNFCLDFNFKEKVNFKIYDLTTWLANNFNTHIAKYLKK